MRGSVKSLRLSGIAAAVTAVWLLCAGPASAGGGGGGEDAASLQSMLCGIAGIFNISCPQYPAYADTTQSPATPISPLTPVVLTLAAWENVNPDDVRIADSDCFQFGNVFVDGQLYCSQVALNAINGPVNPPSSVLSILANLPGQSPAALNFLNPLAFGPTSEAPFTPTPNLNPNAISYVYASVLKDDGGQPQTLDLFFDYVASPNKPGLQGQNTVVIALPLAVLVNGAATETSVVATLTANCNGFGLCRNVQISGNFPPLAKKPPYSPSDLGLSFTYSLVPSPNLARPHPVVELQVPLIVNPQTDPFYFVSSSPSHCPNSNGSNPVSGYCNAFSAANYPNGFAPKVSKNTTPFVVGMAPSAAPQCPGNQPGTKCPDPNSPPVPAPVPPTYGFCASFSKNLAAAFFLAVGTDATTYVSSPILPSPFEAATLACPS
jgi:hypothetical protein